MNQTEREALHKNLRDSTPTELAKMLKGFSEPDLVWGLQYYSAYARDEGRIEKVIPCLHKLAMLAVELEMRMIKSQPIPKEKPQHATTSQSGSYRVACSCGWKCALTFSTKAEAEARAKKHRDYWFGKTTQPKPGKKAKPPHEAIAVKST